MCAARKETAAPWWSRDFVDGESETITHEDGRATTYTFSAARADHVLFFFEHFLRHSKGIWSGRRFRLEPWQRALLRTLFGWIGPDGSRRFRTVFVFLPRKNGKSTLAAGILLYLAFGDFEAGAEVYAAATDKEQAAIVFNEAQAMVRASDDLRRIATVYRGSIVSVETGSRFKVLSADVKNKHGFNTHGAGIDELHAHPNRDLFDVLVTSMGARRQPMTVITTTAGFDRHSVCFEQYTYAKGVADGSITDATYLAILFEAAPEDDWHEEATWAKANPNLGITIGVEFLRAEHRRAVELPGYENTFRRLYLNQWTEQATRWISLDLWNRNAGPDRDEAYWKAVEDWTAFLGVDLSATKDLAAVACVLRNPERTRFIADVKCFVPEDTIRIRSRRDRVRYDVWAKQGWIVSTPGSATDQRAIFDSILEYKRRFRNVVEVACDRWEAQRLMQDLEAEGVVVFAHGMGFQSMSPASKALERVLLDAHLEHGGNPVLAWSVGNAAAVTDPAGGIKPAKDKSRDRIDPLVALIMAIGRSMLERDDERSFYDTPGGRGITL